MRRRWVERPLPNLRRRFKSNRKEAVDGMEWLPLDGIDSPAVMIAGVVAIALFVLVLLPLLREALRELRTTIAAAGPPERLARAEKLATSPARRPGA